MHANSGDSRRISGFYGDTSWGVEPNPPAPFGSLGQTPALHTLHLARYVFEKFVIPTGEIGLSWGSVARIRKSEAGGDRTGWALRTRIRGRSDGLQDERVSQLTPSTKQCDSQRSAWSAAPATENGRALAGAFRWNGQHVVLTAQHVVAELHVKMSDSPSAGNAAADG